MKSRGSLFLGICIIMLQWTQFNCQSDIDPEMRAQLEEKVMARMSLEEIERMVENDERVLSAPKSKIIIVPRPQSNDGVYRPEEMEQKAYIIQRKPKKFPKKAISERESYDLPESMFDKNFRRASFEPKFHYERAFKYDEKFPSLFSIGDLESAGSDPVKSFYESIVERVVAENKNQYMKNPIAMMEAAASDGVLSYSPRFDYDSYSRDPTEEKLKGKSYWQAPQRREENSKGKGCRTVVKKIVDPEGESKSGEPEEKGVVITKECEYPTLDGPDAKIVAVSSDLGTSATRYDSEPSESYDSEVSSYEQSRPRELDFETPKAKDPLEPGYIDSMLDSHFRSFPSFSKPISSFKGYQDRFKLQIPSDFKDVKPTVNVQSYDYSHPESGFTRGSDREVSSDSTSFKDDSSASFKDDAPVTYERQQQYEEPQKGRIDFSGSRRGLPKAYEQKYNYEYPERKPIKPTSEDEVDDNEPQKYSKNPEKKPKMMKKSFAYYRKDTPKEDPNDQHYAEEYAQGNFRSFSSSYDSEKDGPKKN